MTTFRDITAAVGERRGSMLTNDVARTLRTASAPMIVALLTVGSVGVADAFFVGRLGTRALAGLGYCIPLFYLVAAVWLGFGIGVTSVISRAIGAGDLAAARRAGVDSLLLGVPLLFILAVSLSGLESVIFAVLGVSPQLRPAVGGFIEVLALGMPALAFVIAISAILRAHGQLRASGLLLVLASVCNVVCDPLFIFGAGPLPAMGLKGVALASIVGYGAAAVVAIRLVPIHRLLSLASPDTRFVSRAADILAVSVPAVLSQGVRPAALVGLTVVVSAFGEEAVAAFAAGVNVERVIVNVFLGLASGLAPFVGQNWGAGFASRVSHAIRTARTWALCAGLGLWFVLGVFADQVAQLFAEESVARLALTHLLWILPAGFGVAGVTLVSVGALNAVGRGKTALGLVLLEQLGLVLPLAFVGGYCLGFQGVLLGVVLGKALAALESWRRLRSTALVTYANERTESIVGKETI